MMIAPLAYLSLPSPEKARLGRAEEKFENEVPPSLIRGSGAEEQVITTKVGGARAVDDEDEVVELDVEEAHQQSVFTGRPSSAIPKPVFNDGLGFFVRGLTLPPLSRIVLQQAREAGTSSMANDFGYYMGRVMISAFYVISLFNAHD